jgi:site-specific recombinase XerD
MTIQEVITRFLAHIEATQAANTAQTYGHALRRFSDYLRERKLGPETSDISSLTLPLASDYILWLYQYLLDRAQGDAGRISAATRGTYLAAISRFFEYLIVEMQYLPYSMDEYDQLRKVLDKAGRRRVRQELSPDKLPTAEIIQTLREAAFAPPPLAENPPPPGERRRQELARLRNIALIECLLSSGMRISEACRLRRRELLYDAKGALLRHTKGDKEREVLFSEEAWRALQSYLQDRQDGAQARALADLPVFARHDRKAGGQPLPLSKRGAQAAFYELAQRAGILDRFRLTPHTLRHFFATEFLSKTGDLALTQYALGHSSPNTTRIYAQTKREDYRRAHQDVFGRQ